MNKNKLSPLLLLLIALSFPFSARPQASTWTLQQCINEALTKNIQLNITRRTNDINQVNLDLAKYAQYPSLNGSANQGFSFGRSLNPVTYQYVNQNILTNTFSLTGSLVLYEGGQLVNTMKQDKELFEAGKMDIETYKNTIIISVANSYLQLLLDNELIKIADSTIKTDKKQVNITNVMVTAGSVPELNLYQVQSQLAADQLTLTNDQNQQALDRLTLEQLMDKADSATFDIDKPKLADPSTHIDSIPSGTIYDKSVESQPQIKSTELKLAGANYGIDVAKGNAYPRLLLNGSIATNYSSSRTLSDIVYQPSQIGYVQGSPGTSVYGLVPTETTSPYLFPNQIGDNIKGWLTFALVVPIFNNYIIRGNVQQAVINRDVAQLNDKYTRQQYRQTIEQDYTGYYGASKQYASTLEALRTETEAYNTMQVKYKSGSANATDLILEQNKFFSAQSQVAQAKYSYIFKQKVLDFYLGKPITL